MEGSKGKAWVWTWYNSFTLSNSDPLNVIGWWWDGNPYDFKVSSFWDKRRKRFGFIWGVRGLVRGVERNWSADVFLMSTLRAFRFNYPLRSEWQKDKSRFSTNIKRNKIRKQKNIATPNVSHKCLLYPCPSPISEQAQFTTILCLSLIWDQAGVNDPTQNLSIQIKSCSFLVS